MIYATIAVAFIKKDENRQLSYLPSYHWVRVKLLKMQAKTTMNVLSEFKQEWKRTGCTIFPVVEQIERQDPYATF